MIARHLLDAVAACDPGEARTGLCHRDFCGENMLVDRHGRLCVIDNETLIVGPLDFDLQRTACRWRLSADQWAVFLHAYQVHRWPRLSEGTALFWRLRALTLSAAFRIRHGSPPAPATLVELETYAALRDWGHTPLAQDAPTRGRDLN